MVDTGRASFLLAATSVRASHNRRLAGFSINFSSSFVATAIYQVTPVFSFIVPVRMLYNAGVGWNPFAEAGI
ncbi:MAG: hypothetical protein WDO73_06650 [Ignavibacteriota bacterium]